MFSNRNYEYAGLPYDDINWYDIVGQPFGIASYFNAIILKDANNIVDTKGAMAVGGNFRSQRGLTLAYGNEGNLSGTGYSPDFVRFLVGRDVEMQGPLVVIGHVVAGGNFRAGRGSTYMIGKDGSGDQEKQLSDLYQADRGSKYWSVSDRGTHYAISSYDVPRYIPAARIGADVTRFFEDAQKSLTHYTDCITKLTPNGTVTEHYHEWILAGNDPNQNIFFLDVSPNGVLDKEMHFEIPQGSLGIVIIRTGTNAHLKYGLWGSEALADHILYVFEDARNIYMEVPAAIWGSILAPQAEFYANQSGGTVNGNAALGSLEVNAGSGFEFHLYPFVGGLVCSMPEQAPAEEVPETVPAPIEIPQPAPMPVPAPAPTPVPCPPCPEAAPCPMPQPCPEAAPCPMPQPCPEAAPCPMPQPCPEAAPCPMPQPCPEAAPCPMPQPCPEAAPCPMPQPCPEAAPCPMPQPCPEAAPCPVPRPCPEVKECPPCPECRGPEKVIEIQPIPIPIAIKLPCPKQEKCEECLITPGVIYGCIWGCCCGRCHEWEVKLYRSCGEKKILLECIKIGCCGCFEFTVPYDDFYILEACPVGIPTSSRKCCKKIPVCKPVMTLKNVGVANLIIE